MRMRSAAWVCMMVFLIQVGATAGAIYTNDTGDVAYGLRVSFQSSVVIVSHSPALPVQEPEGESMVFTFSGGEVPPGGSFWLSWRPGNVGVSAVEWITHPSATGPAERALPAKSSAKKGAFPKEREGHLRREEYEAEFTGPDGETIHVNIERERSWEAIPFVVSYHLELPGDYRVVAVADDPGLFELSPHDANPGDIMVPVLKIDDFSDTDLVSELGTEWQFRQLDERIDTFMVGKSLHGYGLVFNGNNGAALSLGGLDASSYAGLYLKITGSGLIDWDVGIEALHVALNGSSVAIRNIPILINPRIYRLPLREFGGLELADLKELGLTLQFDSPDIPLEAGMAVYDIGFYTTLDRLVQYVEPSDGFDFRFAFKTNSVPHAIRFIAVNAAGRVFTYQEELDFPLHTDTEIVLDAGRAFAGEEIASASWRLSDVDPNEDVDLNGVRAVYRTEWPDVKYVTVTAMTTGGEPLEKRFYALVYWRDGCPIPRRGFQAINLWRSSGYYKKIVENIMRFGRELGYNMFNIQVMWYYDWPDKNGNFDIQPIPCEYYYDDRGCSTTEKILERYVPVAQDLGYSVTLWLKPVQYGNDSRLAKQYHTSGGTPGGRCFICEDGFLYDEGHGYWDMIMHFKPLLTELGVGVVSFGAEIGAMEKGVYPNVRKFFSKLAKEWRDFPGLITYTSLDWTPSSWRGYNAYLPYTNQLIFDPKRYSVPYNEMGLVAFNEYQVLATRDDSSIDEMYRNALRRVTGFMRRLHETYDKPLFIQDCVIRAYKGVLLEPPSGAHRNTAPRDDAAQAKYTEAWLRAFSHAIRDLGYDFFYGITIGAFQMVADTQYAGDPNNFKGPEYNLKPYVLDTFRVYLKDNPIEN